MARLGHVRHAHHLSELEPFDLEHLPPRAVRDEHQVAALDVVAVGQPPGLRLLLVRRMVACAQGRVRHGAAVEQVQSGQSSANQ